MAVTLGDIVYRRTDLAGKGLADDETLTCAARAMSEELGWTDERTADEVSRVQAYADRWKTDAGATRQAVEA